MTEIYHAYMIINTVDDLTYVGCTSTALKTRMNDHRYSAKIKKTKLYKHMREVGPNKFSLKLLESKNCNKKEARILEQSLMDLLKPELNSIRSIKI